MKRWASTILLFLLLVSGGAIVNIAVAWGWEQSPTFKGLVTASIANCH